MHQAWNAEEAGADPRAEKTDISDGRSNVLACLAGRKHLQHHPDDDDVAQGEGPLQKHGEGMVAAVPLL